MLKRHGGHGMRENRTGTTFWGGRSLVLAAALMLLMILAVSCSEDARGGEDAAISSETVEVRLAGNSDALAAKALTATNESYTLAESSDLYWTYTAVKDDNYFKTGQSELDDDGNPVEADLNTDDSGNAVKDLPDKLPGTYSLGKWIFTFNAYKEVTTTDDEGTETTSLELYYQGEATSVTLSSGGENTVSVSVSLVEATGETGTLVVYGITFINQDGETQTLSDITLWYSIDDGTLTEDSDEAMLASSADDGLTFDELEPGSHTFYACVTDTSGNVLASGSASAIVKPNLTTTITGDIEEAEDATTSVTLGSLSVSYGSISVSSEDGLTAALADSEVSTVTLESDISLTGYLSVTGDTTIDLGGNTLTTSSYGLVVRDGGSLTIEDGTVSSYYYPLYLQSGGSLTVESGTYSSSAGYAAIVCNGTASSYDPAETEITINGGTFSSSSNPTIFNYLGDTSITITGGEFTSDSYPVIYNSDDLELVIEGGTFTSSYAAISNYSGDLDLTITDGTFTAPYGILISDGTDNASIDIDGGTFESSAFTLYVNGAISDETDIEIDISDGTFNGEIYLAGCTDTSISGGTFYCEDMQAVHLRSGKIAISGGTFETGLTSDSFDYEYMYYGSGSFSIPGDVVIEASNSGYGAITSVEITGGTFSNLGIGYYVNPDYSEDDPTITVAEAYTTSTDSASAVYHEHTSFQYRKEVTYSSYTFYAYFNSEDDAEAFSFEGATIGDLETGTYDSSTGRYTF